MTYFPFLCTANVRLTENTALTPGNIKKHNGILLEEGYTANPQISWEQRIDNGYPTVFYDEEAEEYRLYYSVFINDISHTETALEDRKNSTYRETGSRVSAALLATSKDGENWVRPNLGLCEFQGSTDNNILKTYIHGVSVLRDTHEENPDKKYKMVLRNDKNGHMAVSFSPDGIHFCEPVDWIGTNPLGDTHNYVWYDEKYKKYICITRTWENNLRICSRSESTDFINWSPAEEAYRGDGLDDQLYSMTVFEKDSLYYGLGSFFHGGNRTAEDFDCVDLELMYSHDTKHWNRVCKGTPFIPRGKGRYGDGEPDCGCIFASPPLSDGENLVIYYFGGNGQHTNFRETSLMKCTACKDELFGYKSDKRTSRLMTTAFEITGNELFIRADVRDIKDIKIGISDFFRFHNEPIYKDGFTPEDSKLEKVSENLYKVTFSKALSEASGKVHIVVIWNSGTVYGVLGKLKRF